MKKLLVAFSLFALASCNTNTGTETTKQEPLATEKQQAKPVDLTKSFDELYTKVDPKDLDINIFNILNKDWSIITAGTESDYNSMIASWGGIGIIFGKNVAWQFLNAKRYTLEYIKREGVYTLSFADSTYKEQKLALGTKSGRDSDKMKENKLTPVKTPAGSMAYKEAYMIFELQLDGLNQINPEGLKVEEDKKFIIEGKGDGKEYHNMVTGAIINIWVRNN